MLRTHGPEEALRRLRAAEAEPLRGGATPDDASVAFCEPEPTRMRTDGDVDLDRAGE